MSGCAHIKVTKRLHVWMLSPKKDIAISANLYPGNTGLCGEVPHNFAVTNAFAPNVSYPLPACKCSGRSSTLHAFMQSLLMNFAMPASAG